MKGLSLVDQIAACQLPKPELEVKFHPLRRWRADMLWRPPTAPIFLICEIEGGVWKPKSRHQTGRGFTEDAVKYAEATCLGYQVLRVTTQQVENGQAIGWLERLLKEAK
jgi:hypothetical protein